MLRRRNQSTHLLLTLGGKAFEPAKFGVTYVDSEWETA